MVQAETLEAMAFREALALASDLYINKVQVVTDCLATINHLRGLYLGQSAAIISDIRKKMKEFAAVQLSHERREKN